MLPVQHEPLRCTSYTNDKTVNTENMTEAMQATAEMEVYNT